MDKIKCIRSINNIIIPIKSIAFITPDRRVWISDDSDNSNRGYKLSDRTYERLLEELEFIDAKGFID